MKIEIWFESGRGRIKSSVNGDHSANWIDQLNAANGLRGRKYLVKITEPMWWWWWWRWTMHCMSYKEQCGLPFSFNATKLFWTPIIYFRFTYYKFIIYCRCCFRLRFRFDSIPFQFETGLAESVVQTRLAQLNRYDSSDTDVSWASSLKSFAMNVGLVSFVVLLQSEQKIGWKM